MSALLGFTARINGIDYPVAVFKSNGRNGYCWPWIYPTNGCMLIADLISGEKHLVYGSWQSHESQHANGVHHQRIVNAGRSKISVSSRRTWPVSGCPDWASILSVPVPLIEPFSWATQSPPWPPVKSPHRLERHDFDGAEGIYLDGYVCESERVDDLLHKRPEAVRHWIEGNEDDLRLVVLAVPIKV
jgi:hypothetical protein